MSQSNRVMEASAESSFKDISVAAAPALSSKKRKRQTMQIFEDIPKRGFGITATVSFLIMLAIWSILSYGEFVTPIFLPTPGNVLKSLFEQLGTSLFWNHIGISVFRVPAGFVLACIVAIPIGLFAGTFRYAEAF